MSETHVEVWDRIYFDEQGQPLRWMRSWNKGQSWKEIDCSIFPDGKPPFIRLQTDDAAWIEQRGWVPVAAARQP